MAASFGAATTAIKDNKSSDYLPICHRRFVYRSTSNQLSFRLSAKPKLRFSSKGLQSGWNRSTVVRAQSNEVWFSPWDSYQELISNFRSFVETLSKTSVAFKVSVDGSSNTTASTTVKSEESLPEAKAVKSPNEPPLGALGSEASVSELISQVSSLVKLVDSKDIMELQLKQLDCEILIRKKEALSPPPATVAYVQTQQPQPAVLPPVPAVSPVPTAAPSPGPTQAPALPKALPSKSTHPPFKCPMAGTFYRSPAPGEPPFVKIGDKIKKGQVLCIIEAMKLMNEIEADQSGTLVEIVAEDGKPVSVDTPLFVIQP